MITNLICEPSKSATACHRLLISLCMLATLLIGGCNRPHATTVKFRGVTYVIPANEDVTTSMVSDKFFYVSIGPTNRIDDRVTENSFTLILSDKGYREQRFGPEVPTIAHISDTLGQKLYVKRVNSQTVVCRGHQDYSRCGLVVWDAGLKWSILFNVSQIGNAGQIARTAKTTLASYRRGAQ